MGLAQEESDALLTALKAHAVQRQFQYTHKWQAGDVLMWDNCSVQHKAVSNYALPQRRLIERTTVLGPAEIGTLA